MRMICNRVFLPILLVLVVLICTTSCNGEARIDNDDDDDDDNNNNTSSSNNHNSNNQISKNASSSSSNNNNISEIIFNTSIFETTTTTATRTTITERTLDSSRIIGGTLASYGDFPSFVVGDGCGGTLIYKDIVLTAGHCKGAFAGYQLYIGNGIQSDGSDFDNKIYGLYEVRHPQYSKLRDYENDIMIVKLEKFSTVPIQSLNFDSTIPSDGQIVSACGFGSIVQGKNYNGPMRKVTMNNIASDTCYNKESFYKKKQLCAGVPAGGKDTCQGDSGGPLFVTNNSNQLVQVGIVSNGVGCGQKDYPGIYTRVSYYENFIKNSVCAYTSDTVTNLPSYCSGRQTGLSPPCSCGIISFLCRLLLLCY